jgi:hypothetical protein
VAQEIACGIDVERLRRELDVKSRRWSGGAPRPRPNVQACSIAHRRP